MTVRFSTDEYSLSAMEGPQAAKESMHQERSLHLLSEQIRSKNLGLSAAQAARFLFYRVIKISVFRKLVQQARQILDEYSQIVEARPPCKLGLIYLAPFRILVSSTHKAFEKSGIHHVSFMRVLLVGLFHI